MNQMHTRTEPKLEPSMLLVVALVQLLKRRPKAKVKLVEGERRLKLA